MIHKNDMKVEKINDPRLSAYVNRARHGATCWFHHMEHETGIEYIDLPPFVPEAEQKIKALEEGLQAIKRHMELSKAGALSNVWHIADAALNKSEAIGK